MDHLTPLAPVPDFTLWVERQRAFLQNKQFDQLDRDTLNKEFADHVYKAAFERAGAETGIPRAAFPQTNPYTKEQLLDTEFVLSNTI